MTWARRTLQLSALGLTLGAVFLWGANAELWCPMGGVEALYGYLNEGNMICSLGTTNFFVLGGVIVMTLLVRRAFCGYLCPVGTISDWLRLGAARLRVPLVCLPPSLDRTLGLLKYGVLAAVLYFTWRAGELLFRGFDPCYALISRHGADITAWAYVVGGAVAVASLVIWLPFCRWLCPFAAVLSPFAAFGLTRVKRDAAACSGCGRCAKACPMQIPMDRLPSATSARCLSCQNCTQACPKGASALSWGPPRWLGGRWPRGIVVAVVLACMAGAASAAYLFPLPSFVKTRGTQPTGPLASVEVRIENLSCRGRANMLFWFLERDDLEQLPGYLKLEAWPGPGWASARVTFDPGQVSAQQVRRAIVEPYYNLATETWWESPFRIEGYDPTASD